jgi:hypothetical protein
LIAGGVVSGGVALAALALLVVFLKRRRSARTEAESNAPPADLETYQTGQFGGEDEIAGDYTNPVFDGKGSDEMGDQFEDDIGEL